MIRFLTVAIGFALMILGWRAGAADEFILAAILILAGCAAITFAGSQLLDGRNK